MRYILFVLIMTIQYNLYSQCSDAGVCSIAHASQMDKDSSNLKVGLTIQRSASAKADDIRYTVLQPEIHYSFTTEFSVHGKFPYSWQSGPLGKVWGIGDPIVSGLYRLYQDKERSVHVSAGVRITFGNDKEQSLPQAYQSSLGATDYLFGATYSEFGFTLSAGYQFAGGRNNNITRLERGNDALVGLNYGFKVTDNLSVKPEVLYIKRLGESTIVDTNISSNMFVSVPNSAQTQLNVGLGGTYSVNKKTNISFYFAVPTLKREVNVDGLTRSYTVSVGLETSL